MASPFEGRRVDQDRGGMTVPVIIPIRDGARNHGVELSNGQRG